MISVITPVFNGQRFIESCIKSVIEQECPTAEHIFVDGGSTDGTVEIIRQYARDYPHIRWVSEKDQGQSDAMNKGIAMAQGEIIGFLNVDDFYEPNVLNRVVEMFRVLQEPALVVGNCNVWNDDNQLDSVNKPNRLRLRDLLLADGPNEMPLNPSAYFYHARLHDKVGPYKVDEPCAMDLDFLLRAVQVANVKYVDETWGNYRRIAGTKTVRDIENGNNLPRVRRVLRFYQADLSLLDRLVLTVQRGIYFSVGSSFRYFSRHPDELPSRLKARLGCLFGITE